MKRGVWEVDAGSCAPKWVTWQVVAGCVCEMGDAVGSVCETHDVMGRCRFCA